MRPPDLVMTRIPASGPMDPTVTPGDVAPGDVDELARRIAAMRAAVARGDGPTLARIAHLLPPLATALDDAGCLEACRELAAAAAVGIVGETTVFLAQLEDELDRLRAADLRPSR